MQQIMYVFIHYIYILLFRWSTMQLRQCKASIFEGGIRVPGIMHAPGLIQRHINVTTPTFTGDFLPTILALLGVKTDNPTWIMDGMNLLEIIRHPTGPRGKPIPMSWGGQVRFSPLFL